MSAETQGSVAAFGYRHPHGVTFAQIVDDIDDMLQRTDPMPRRLNWVNADLAWIDRDDTRIALGHLPPDETDSYSYIVIAVGTVPGCKPDGLSDVSHSHFTDRLVYRFREDLPFDTIMRGETPEPVDEAMMQSLFELLRHAPSPTEVLEEASAKASGTKPAAKSKANDTLTHNVDVIRQSEIEEKSGVVKNWCAGRAESSNPLRLTVHTMALSVMLYSPPLGAFMYTYSMLRDISGTE